MQKSYPGNPGGVGGFDTLSRREVAVCDPDSALADRDGDFVLTPKTLQIILEWAGQRLEALHAGKIKPSGPKVIWPEYSQEKFQILEFRGQNSPRSAGPSSSEISVMDEILLLPNLCRDELTRRLIHRRLLIHPISLRYKHKWSDVAEEFQMKISNAKFKHKKGLEEIIKKAPRAEVCRFAAFVHR